jgi:phosphoadenosine phosphosulfate reductase
LPELESTPAFDLLKWAIDKHGDRFAIATSFQKEGMVIVDMASQIAPGVRVFTLDTGRLPDETVEMIRQTKQRYGIDVEIVRPDAREVEQMVADRGRDLFYESVENRKLCCEIRKVRPMERKLRELQAWATGLRHEQSEARAAIRSVEEVDGRLRLAPLADWTAAQVEEYVREYAVPVHPLYAQGYTSIGCAPCTRAINPGEDERAGRWWWEQDTQKECGIHFAADGTVKRA